MFQAQLDLPDAATHIKPQPAQHTQQAKDRQKHLKLTLQATNRKSFLLSKLNLTIKQPPLSCTQLGKGAANKEMPKTANGSKPNSSPAGLAKESISKWAVLNGRELS